MWKNEFDFWIFHIKIRLYGSFHKNLRKKGFFEIFTCKGHTRTEVLKRLMSIISAIFKCLSVFRKSSPSKKKKSILTLWNFKVFLKIQLCLTGNVKRLTNHLLLFGKQSNVMYSKLPFEFDINKRCWKRHGICEPCVLPHLEWNNKVLRTNTYNN